MLVVAAVAEPRARPRLRAEGVLGDDPRAVAPDDAKELLDEWLEWASRSRLAPFVKLARTIRKHAVGILAYLDTKMTNGPLEGINNKPRVIARRAYGFHTQRHTPAFSTGSRTLPTHP